MTTKNCANGPKLVLKDLCEKSFVRNVLYSEITRDGAKSNVAKWNLIGGVQFKQVKHCLMFI